MHSFLSVLLKSVYVILSLVTYIVKVNGVAISHSTLDVKSSKLRFVAIGDWGSDRDGQREEAAAIGKWCDENECDFIISTGDNFYVEQKTLQITSANDSRFYKTWRDVYNQSSITDLTWNICVGNHDHGDDDGREWYQVEHSKIEPRWYFPSLVYSFEMNAGSSKVKFVSIDTQSLRRDKNNPDDMLGFLAHELDDHADWKIVFGHHPGYSCGSHAGSSTIRHQVIPILQNYDADIYLSGHDHNQEHWQAEHHIDIDHVITGAGGGSIYGFDQKNYEDMRDYGMDLKFFKDDYGFAYFEIDDHSIAWQFINSDLEVLYQYSRHK